MSGKNGNGGSRIDKYLAQVSEEAGLTNGETLPFAPDFLDCIAQRIATSTDMAEMTFAWTVYRASGNKSRHAIHLYGEKGKAPVETILRQRDCGLEIAWLRDGHRHEWLDAPLHIFREEAARRQVTPLDKSLISEGFTENKQRGIIARNTGYRVELIPSPSSDFVGYSPEHLRKKGESPEYREFEASWKVAHSAEHYEEEVARSIIKRITKVRLSAYKQWRKSRTPQTNDAPSLEALETLEPPPPLTPSEQPPAPEQKADEEENRRLPVPPPNTPTPALPAIRAPYDVFKAMYPPAHFDEGKARPVFQSKTALEQVHVLQQLHRYRECDRWRDRDGRWIPLASNWLKSYDADPPPAFRPADTKTDELRQELEDTANLARWLNTGGVK